MFMFARSRFLTENILEKISQPNTVRFASVSNSRDYLKERLSEIIPDAKNKVKAFKAEHGLKVIDSVTVEQVLGGMRGIKAIYHDGSLLDSSDGIRFRGLTCNDVRKKLPKAFGSEEPLPEGIFWLLLTGEVPTKSEVEWLSSEWVRRAELPHNVLNTINTFPDNLHPMAQLSAAVTTLSRYSQFSNAYHSKNVKKEDLWKPMYEDCMNLIAKIPVIAAKIYRNSYHDGQLPTISSDKDWGYNYARMLGVSHSESFMNFMRLYLIVHADHEGGNVSSHTGHLVGSALSDVFLAYSAAMNGLAGPLHGRANQEVMEFLEKILTDIGDNFKDEKKLEEYCREHLIKGVIPGFGHAVLRITDPRFTIFGDFAKSNINNSTQLLLVEKLFHLVPKILGETGKVKNPFPNVDCITGSILDHYNLKELEYFTVPFAVSRCLGITSSLIWDRALSFPLERPNSLNFEALQKLVATPKK